MKKRTFERRLSALIAEVNNHSHVEEILNIIQEQVLDDTHQIAISRQPLH